MPAKSPIPEFVEKLLGHVGEPLDDCPECNEKLAFLRAVEAKLREGPLSCLCRSDTQEQCWLCNAIPRVAAFICEREWGLVADHRRIEGEQFDYWSTKCAEKDAEIVKLRDQLEKPCKGCGL